MKVQKTSDLGPGNQSRRGFARLLWRLADLVQAAERRRSFRAKAYRQAVWSLDDLAADLEVSDEQLLATPGIGPGVAALVREYRTTGHINQLVSLEEAYPRETPRLRRLPRMTPKMLHDLKSGLGVESRADLLEAIDAGAAGTLRGVGEQTIELWRKILELAPSPEHIPAHEAWVVARSLADHIARHTDCWVDLAGDVRRVEEWVDRVDLVAVTDDPGHLEDFIATTAVLDDIVETNDDLIRARTHTGVPVAVHHAVPEEAGTRLIEATGPAEHAASVTKDPFPTEHEAYGSVGLVFVPAPARGLAVERAGGVVTVEELRGDLHLHSNLSPDGRMTLETILTIARDRAYEYVLITDHTQGLRFGGLGPEEIMAQATMIQNLRPHFPDITVFHGAELNIGPDGLLDLPEEALSTLDFAVAGVHSHFQLDGTAQTERVLAALGHPAVRVLAHPFGRRIGTRPALDIDMDAIIDAAISNGVALETNGHRDRLDLPAEWVGIAATKGAMIAANSDAHRTDEMGNVANAVATLQRAGVTATQVVNALDVAGIARWLARGRATGGEGGI